MRVSDRYQEGNDSLLLQQFLFSTPYRILTLCCKIWESQKNNMKMIIPYPCSITSLLLNFDTVMSYFIFLSFHWKSEKSNTKTIIPCSSNISSLLLHFDTVQSDFSFLSLRWMNTKKIIPYSCNITSLLHNFDTVLSYISFLHFNLEKIIPYYCCITYLLLHFWYCAVRCPCSDTLDLFRSMMYDEN